MALETKSGKPVNLIGIGTWMMGGDFDEITRSSTPNYENDDIGVKSIQHSLSIGQNHIDTAEMYGDGHTDEIVGYAIRDFRRDDIYIADKLWKNSFGHDETNRAVELMLKRLGTDYIDLLYIHSTFDDRTWEKAIDPINDLIDQKVIRQFGVSNFSEKDMARANELSRHKIAANQMHFNCVYKDEVPENFISFCRENQIDIVAYRPVERGDALENSIVQKVANKHGATPAQVAIAWLIMRSYHAIPKASQIAHVDENFEATGIKLDESDFELLDAI